MCKDNKYRCILIIIQYKIKDRKWEINILKPRYYEIVVNILINNDILHIFKNKKNWTT